MSPPPEAVLSIHDVMPETLERVEQILACCAANAIPPLTLLVVPGRDWRPAELDRLRDWSRQGHALAAHGWHHQVTAPRGLYHRLHAALISRNAAEHLALDEAGIAALMQDSHDWFANQGLPAPSLYVPPAWALGRVSGAAIRSLPYRHIEVLRGLLSVSTGRLVSLPLIGFEADTPGRALALRGWNRLQIQAARLRNRPLRISVHPQDLDLRLGRELTRLLQRPFRYLSYDQAMRAGSPAAPETGSPRIPDRRR